MEKSGNLKETSENQGIYLKSQGICDRIPKVREFCCLKFIFSQLLFKEHLNFCFDVAKGIDNRTSEFDQLIKEMVYNSDKLCFTFLENKAKITICDSSAAILFKLAHSCLNAFSVIQ